MKQKSRNGVRIETKDGQEKVLSLLYGSLAGRVLLKMLTKPVLSKAAGAFLSTGLSCFLIRPFIKKNKIDMRQFEKTRYQSYNEFFSRKIKNGARPIDGTPEHLISPCDSKLTVLPIRDNTRFTIKNTGYTVASLLKNKNLAAEYANGYAMIFRLTVDDYHRYCYVDDGAKEENIFIPGVLHTVNPIANDHYPIYKQNSREYTLLHSQNFGDIVCMEVGALLVGKIVNHHERVRVKRGQEKGHFQFGGSTVVLLFKAGAVEVDADILENSQSGYETVVKMGEKIGQKRSVGL